MKLNDIIKTKFVPPKCYHRYGPAQFFVEEKGIGNVLAKIVVDGVDYCIQRDDQARAGDYFFFSKEQAIKNLWKYFDDYRAWFSTKER